MDETRLKNFAACVVIFNSVIRLALEKSKEENKQHILNLYIQNEINEDDYDLVEYDYQYMQYVDDVDLFTEELHSELNTYQDNVISLKCINDIKEIVLKKIDNMSTNELINIIV